MIRSLTVRFTRPGSPPSDSGLHWHELPADVEEALLAALEAAFPDMPVDVRRHSTCDFIEAEGFEPAEAGRVEAEARRVRGAVFDAVHWSRYERAGAQGARGRVRGQGGDGTGPRPVQASTRTLPVREL